MLAQLPGQLVIELGPGTGRLAADLLVALAARDALPDRYCLLEVSPDLRERQREHLRQRAPDASRRVEWIDVLPDRWRGVLLANEVLDAVPPHLIARRGGAWLERGVERDVAGNVALRRSAVGEGRPSRRRARMLSGGGRLR